MSLKNLIELGPQNVRQGRYIYTEVTDWWCGDDYCNCHQVQAQRHYENPLTNNAARWFVRIWEGRFFTDGEGHDERMRDLMQAHHDIRLRLPLDRWGAWTLPANPHDYPVDHSDDAALRSLALSNPLDPNTPIPSPDDVQRALAEIRSPFDERFSASNREGHMSQRQ